MAKEPANQIVLAGFDGLDAADAAYDRLREIERLHSIELEDAAILEMDSSSKLHIKDVNDMTGTKGAVIGGTVGAIVGAITGPVGWAALGGAAVGGLVAKLRDSGFDQHRLEQFGASLEPDSSAFVARVAPRYAHDVEDNLGLTARRVLTLEIGADLANELESIRM